ncbi:ribonuclease T2 family protein [Aquamicrobium zhengzhouense]|uniref:Ribonuclease n=1 Tax=Aquamicrobium zhengzhouense TaxID=2781738 RepID=A0ABS0SAI7_9HYPH|nr:ribonuclease [Aquamicrobium zhengzhouense]MBI1620292.1 ribonuclease [Aquamicrobium zhengzhouense]
MSRRIATLALGLLLSACQPDTAGSLPQGEGFDFFVLSLSWSPTHCEIEGDRANRQQCGGRRNFDFIVHGLWPQFEKGWPEFCQSREPSRVPNDLVREMADIMPSGGLVGHQWRKHGSCSGLSQEDYFSLVRAAWDRIDIPDAFEDTARAVTTSPAEVESVFRRANPSIPANGIAVTCQNRMISEVRICMTKSLEFRSCAEIDSKGCKMPRATLPASGG